MTNKTFQISIIQSLILIAFCLCMLTAEGQKTEKVFLKIATPAKDLNTVNASRQFITGLTCKNCTVIINEEPVKVYSTGAFAYQILLQPGQNIFTIKANDGKKNIERNVQYLYVISEKALAVSGLQIASVQTFPEGDLYLQPGDKIQFKVKAMPGATVYTYNKTPLFEQPEYVAGITGIYQGEYIIQSSDTFSGLSFPVVVEDSAGKSIMQNTSAKFSVFRYPYVLLSTKGRLSHLEYGLGDDRLGGAKIGYLDSNIILKANAKIGKDYRIELAPGRTAYIEDDLVSAMPAGSFGTTSLTGNISVTGDDQFDYVQVALNARLPYQSKQLIEPSKIIVDIFGATSNTNWMQQFQSAKEISNIDYEQIGDGVLRLTLQLKNKQHWGHHIYYRSNTLVIKVKQQPNKKFNDLTIAIDAGHGGTNSGAIGLTGAIEKDLTLAVSLKLQQALEKEGVKVIMTRTKEQFFDNKERILFYRDSLPDLLLSIHLNSSSDPINIGGVSTYYKYIGFRPLSYHIQQQMLELGLKDYANTGSFNFMLNSPTEYPNALVEILFLSNPAEEEKILDPVFQQQVADKIVMGLKDFLQSTKK